MIYSLSPQHPLLRKATQQKQRVVVSWWLRCFDLHLHNGLLSIQKWIYGISCEAPDYEVAAEDNACSICVKREVKLVYECKQGSCSLIDRERVNACCLRRYECTKSEGNRTKIKSKWMNEMGGAGLALACSPSQHSVKVWAQKRTAT